MNTCHYSGIRKMIKHAISRNIIKIVTGLLNVGVLTTDHPALFFLISSAFSHVTIHCLIALPLLSHYLLLFIDWQQHSLTIHWVICKSVWHVSNSIFFFSNDVDLLCVLVCIIYTNLSGESIPLESMLIKDEWKLC